MWWRAPALGILLWLCAAPAHADTLPGVENTERAHVNYMLHCQGCHGPDGRGTIDDSVPQMKGFVGNFLKVDGGREFLVRVPGSANSAMTDAELAEVLNWMLPNISRAQMPANFEPYTAGEITRLRAEPLQDVLGERERLINQLQQ